MAIYDSANKITIRTVALIVAAVFVILSTSGCSVQKADSNGKPNVVTVIFPQYDMARAVAGDRANVHMIMMPGAEVHGYEPSPTDIRLIANANVFIYGGGESDIWIKNILDTLDTDNIKIVSLMDHVKLWEEESIHGDETHMHDHSHHGHSHVHDSMAEYDEHIWTSPKNAEIMTNAICDALSEIDKENAEEYRKNALEYTSEIKKLDAELERVTQSARTHFIAVGDRFPFLYLTKEYGLEYIAAFSGCTPESDASPSVIIRIIETVRKNHIPVVFYTELSDRKMANTICEETGAKPLMLHSCQSISKKDFDSGKTYVDIMKDNIKNLEEALS